MARFNDTTAFFEVRFNNLANFSEAHFNNHTLFTETDFHGQAAFSHTRFHSRAIFSYSHFNSQADFTQARFDDQTRFTKTILPDTLIFNQLQLESLKADIDFRTSQLNSTKNGKCLIFLRFTDISKLILPAHLFTIGFDFEENEGKQTRLDEITRVYEQLIKKCRDLGLMSSAQDWEIEYKQRLNEQYPLGGLLSFINLYWWNFGYDKWRILWIWLPLFYFVFVAINLWKLNWMVKSVYHDEELGKNFNLSYKVLTTTQQRIAYTLFYTAVIYFNFKLRHEAVNYKNLVGLIYLYLIYCVGTIHVAFGVLGYILKT